MKILHVRPKRSYSNLLLLRYGPHAALFRKQCPDLSQRPIIMIFIETRPISVLGLVRRCLHHCVGTKTPLFVTPLEPDIVLRLRSTYEHYVSVELRYLSKSVCLFKSTQTNSRSSGILNIVEQWVYFHFQSLFFPT